MTDKDALLREVLPYLRYANKGAMMAEESNGHLSSLIDRITTALAEKDGEWIKCSERLPDEGEDVLLYCGWRITGKRKGIGYFTEDEATPIHHVTKWRPLPPLPKGDE